MQNFIATLTATLLVWASAHMAVAAENHDEPEKLPIVLTLFLHDELTDQALKALNNEYLDWFTDDLEYITGRKVDIVTVARKPGYTDFDYRLGDADKSIQEWDQRVIDYVVSEQKPRDKRHKYLLITRDKLTLFTQGIARFGGRSAIASMTAYRTIAHEVGHTLGASHSDGEFLATAAPAPCITNMFIEDVFFLKNCYRYGDRSAQAIRNYLRETP
ncbi:hypothetical protein N5D61_06460 [Pseudomonas sp. GD03842]|uniref:reprolysin-like metallopeptidase n=1 Tax=Pseudomonas sp. GD03842 TaxID=2975385 RepID=UPI0024480DF8|nr:hypothetical protein [Pseudomonas sp. GD03842]MDH0745984.1 hypothetical protein [Pseudomonas sp. GD03842]